MEANARKCSWIFASILNTRNRGLRHLGCTYKLNGCSANSCGDDQLFPEVSTGWLSVLLCVQHVLVDPTVYHKVRAVSLENSPSRSVGVFQFLRAKRLEPGWEVIKSLIPQRVCRTNQPLIMVPCWERRSKGSLRRLAVAPIRSWSSSKEKSGEGSEQTHHNVSRDEPVGRDLLSVIIQLWAKDTRLF